MNKWLWRKKDKQTAKDRPFRFLLVKGWMLRQVLTRWFHYSYILGVKNGFFPFFFFGNPKRKIRKIFVFTEFDAMDSTIKKKCQIFSLLKMCMKREWCVSRNAEYCLMKYDHHACSKPGINLEMYYFIHKYSIILSRT